MDFTTLTVMMGWLERAVLVGTIVVLLLLLLRQRRQQSESDLVITGIAIGLPGRDDAFAGDNFASLARGECRIERLDTASVEALLSKRVVQLKKDGEKVPVSAPSQTLAVAGRLGRVDLDKYGVPRPLAKTMGKASQAAVAAGLEAMRDAGLVDAPTWKLPEHLQATTGVVYASSFPGLDAAVAEVERYAESLRPAKADTRDLLRALKDRIIESREKGPLVVGMDDEKNKEGEKKKGSEQNKSESSKESDDKKKRGDPRRAAADCDPPEESEHSGDSTVQRLLASLARALDDDDDDDDEKKDDHEKGPNGSSSTSPTSNGHHQQQQHGEEKQYTFDRKFLFKVLVLGNAQLAQITGAKGPNAQTNAACAGTTQAMAIAEDWLRAGRCERVVVVAGDDASGDALLPWLGGGFNALGAASVAATPRDAARPFDARRNGMVLGAGACGLVLEKKTKKKPNQFGGDPKLGRAAAAAAADDDDEKKNASSSAPPKKKKKKHACRLVATSVSNSAFHGAAMDRQHIAGELGKFLELLERRHGLSRSALAASGMYLSHETGTHATPSSSCSFNEIFALKQNFSAADLSKLVLVNTKALTGHPMGVGFEDAFAAFALSYGEHVPPLPADTVLDDHFDAPLNLPLLGSRQARRTDIKYALRFAAGFGSQVAFALYARA